MSVAARGVVTASCAVKKKVDASEQQDAPSPNDSIKDETIPRRNKGKDALRRATPGKSMKLKDQSTVMREEDVTRTVEEILNKLREEDEFQPTPLSSEIDTVEDIQSAASSMEIGRVKDDIHHTSNTTDFMGEDEHQTTEDDHLHPFVRQSPAARALPLPPFLRPAARLKDRPFVDLKYAGVARLGRNDTFKDSFKHAPFSTAFAQNPYAHALATPVRQCSFTGLRLPTSCFLDFHLVPITPSNAQAWSDAAPTHAANILALVPLSLSAALIPKNKAPRKRTEAEDAVLDAQHAASDRYNPVGTASYVTNQRAALAFASSPAHHAHRQQRARQFIAGRRAQATLSEENGATEVGGTFGWRRDMPEVVLEALRRVVVKKLRFFFAAKQGNPDKPGLVAEVPGGERGRLDEMQDVVAVLRLREPVITPKDNAEVNESVDENGAQAGVEEVETIPEAPRLAMQEVQTPTAPRQTRIHHTGSWTASMPAHLHYILPLPPPPRPAQLYFPTVRYRNQRIALYNLVELLGEEGTKQVLKGTVFASEAGKECEWVAVKAHRSTVNVLNWFAKLVGYMAGGKRESAEVSVDITKTPRVQIKKQVSGGQKDGEGGNKSPHGAPDFGKRSRETYCV